MLDRKPSELPVDAPADTKESETPGSDKKTGLPGGQSARVELPGISKPVGGGAIRSINERLSVAAATGAATLSVPIPLPSGRAGIDPSFELAYSSGSGASAFGLGWSLDAPQIARRSDLGVPRFADAMNGRAADSDVFTFAGDDLVAILENGVPWRIDRVWHGRAYRVRSYRQRTEGSFLRAEHWTDIGQGQSHWRVIGSDNTITLFGLSATSRVADPRDASRIAVWLADLTFDDKGNLTQFRYFAEDSRSIESRQSHEAHRSNSERSVQRYLKSVHWANRAPWSPDWSENGAMPALPEFRYSMTIDYGDHSGETPGNVPDQGWPARHDPFSTYRYGFEVRTYRRARRILVHHRFPEEDGFGEALLVRSLSLEYSDDALPHDAELPAFSLLTAVRAFGHRRVNGNLVSRSLPPLELSYTAVTHGDVIHAASRSRLGDLPSGLAGASRQWVDFDGDGIAGVLELGGREAEFTRNLTPIARRVPVIAGDENTVPQEGVWFAPTQRVTQTAALAAGRYQVFDLDDDGRQELVRFDASGAGYHEFDGERLGEYRSFERLPATHSAGIVGRLGDFTGDGRVDIGAASGDRISISPGLGRAGFDETVSAFAVRDRDGHAADDIANSAVRSVDMCGDGLADLVHIGKRGVWYRPNLGWGRYGDAVFMDGSPLEDVTDYDVERVFLADLDGTGTSDLVYVGDGEVLVAYNRGGDRWSNVQRLPGRHTPAPQRDVRIVDLFGRGTKCLVWSSQEPGEQRERLHYLELVAQKPHLLETVRNNRGVETRLYWSQSTRFAAEDRRAGKPWLTRLPFPVHVVEGQESLDRISRVRSVKRFAYHGGHYDGVEKEFRGFSLVESWDTETEQHAIDDLIADNGATNWTAESTIPPTLTRTWYHTGSFVGRNSISSHLADQYWLEPGTRDDPQRMTAALLPDTVLPDGVDNATARDACRSLRGRILRTETYDVSTSGATGVPYSVTEQNYTIQVLQNSGAHGGAVCLATPRETLTFDYERQADDPRIKASCILESDLWGNPVRELAVSYPRREAWLPAEAGVPAFESMLQRDQRRITIAGIARTFTNDISGPDRQHTPLLAEERAFTVAGVAAPGGPADITTRFSFAELDQIWGVAMANPVDPASVDAHELVAAPDPGPPRHRITGVSRTLYRRDDLDGLLPLGRLQSLALPGRADSLALPNGQRLAIFAGDISDQDLADAGYIRHADSADWWARGEEVRFHPDDVPAAEELAEARQHFWLARRSIDPFGNSATATYDDYDLLAVETRDPVGNTFHADIDYRVLQPVLVTDPNGDQVAAVFDTLEHLAAISVQGRHNEAIGDNLQGIVPDLNDAALQAFYADPDATAAAHLGNATTRVISDPWAYLNSRNDPDPRPNWVASINRETHVSDLDDGARSRLQLSFAYLAGTGATIQSKVRVEDGTVQGVDGVVARWLCSGWVRINSKGMPYETFEPLFTADHEFLFDAVSGVSSFTFYDPVGRVVGRLFPDSTLERMDYFGWHTVEWDAADLSLLSDPTTDPVLGGHCERLFVTRNINYTSWHDQRLGGAHGDTAEERQANAAAAGQSAAHAATPNVTHLDATGRPVVTVVMAAADDRRASRSVFDAGGRLLGSMDTTGRYVVQNIIEQPNALPGSWLFGQDLLDRPLTAIDLDGGRVRSFPESDGSTQRLWDARGFRTRVVRDANRRVTHRWLSIDGDNEALVERTFWGDNIAGDPHPDPNARLNAQVYQTFGSDGLVTSERFDFKGNLVSARRTFTRSYRDDPDWAPLAGDLTVAQINAAIAGMMDPDSDFQSSTAYDALSRPVRVTTPNGSGVNPHTVRAGYNRGGLIESLHLWIDDAAPPGDLAAADHAILKSVTYNARRQVTSAVYGNDVRTALTYDPETFRVRVKEAVRPGPAQRSRVQDLLFIYDAVGNPTQISDRSQAAIYYNNDVAHARSTYTYDALYQLIEATGREHLGLSGTNNRPPVQPNHTLPTPINQPSDGRAMGRYTEQYKYDDVGNLLEIFHATSSGQWRRGYAYDEPSRIDAAVTGNRLSAYRAPGDPENGPFTDALSYDEHGNTVSTSHLSEMTWDYLNRLRSSSRQVVINGVPERTYYQYNFSNNRTRKVADRQAPDPAAVTRMSERLYLGGFIELHRTYNAMGDLTLRRETLHFMADGQRIGMIERRTAGNDPAPVSLVRYQYADHLGSGVLELDDQADVISHASYHPFGSIAHHAARSELETPNRYRYTGRERDDETGFSYHGNRYYSPVAARWISPDPFGFVDGPNRYTYVRNNPVRLLDPTGTSGEESFADLSDVVDDLNSDPEVARKLTNTKPDLPQRQAPWTRGKSGTARKAANAQAKAYRDAVGMTGGEVQAGHTAAARHAPESGITRADWDKQPMMQLHSRKGQGLDVEVTDQDGNVKTKTRHTAQEGLIDDAIDRAKQANGGVLTPAAQLEAAEQVKWATENTPWDQRDVENVRNNTVPSENPPGGPKPQSPADAPKQTAAPKPKPPKPKPPKPKIKPKPGRWAKFTKGLKGLGKKATKVVPFVGMGVGVASAAHAASQGDTTTAALDAVGLVPVAGDLVDMARLGVAVGGLADEALGIGEVAAEDGMAVQAIAKSFGASDDVAPYAGAATAAISSITTAPARAAGRRISEAWSSIWD